MRRHTRRRYLRISLAVLLVVAALWSCSTTPPRDLDDSCAIFGDKSSWYKDAKRAFERWGVPIHVQLAIVYQESKFVDDAKPPRDYLLWVIPWGRISSAYGYAQAKDSTWEWYREKSGNRFADRDDFADAVDFIAWYGNMSHGMLGISRSDAYRQYLAYHEGQGGYKRKTYANKPWLLKIARQVDNRAKRYRTQLAQCEEELNSGWSLWPF